MYKTFPSLKIFVKDNEHPFSKENLMFHLSKINDSNVRAPMINFTYTKLKPLDIIYLPSEMKMKFTHTGRAPAGKIEWSQTNKSHDKNPIQSLII